jgi:hypothetical protein
MSVHAIRNHDQETSKPRILTKSEFLGGFVPPDYLVEGMLQRRFIYSLTAKTGDGKTAIALHLAKLVGSTAPAALFGPHTVEKGRVVYFAGENPDDLRMREIADDAVSRHDGTADRIHFIPGVFDVKEMRPAIECETKTLGGIDLVIVDTSAAYFISDDENNNSQMGAHARMLRELTTLPGGPCVIVLCHPVKHVSEPAHLLPRGGGAFLAEVDGNLTAWKRDGLVELSWTGKFRGPGFEPLTFKLEKITTAALVDSKGRMIPTVRAVSVSELEQQMQSSAARKDEDRLLVAMRIKGRSVADLAIACGWKSDSGTPSKSKVSRLLGRLVDDGLAEMFRGTYRLTKNGEEVADKAVVGMYDLPA